MLGCRLRAGDVEQGIPPKMQKPPLCLQSKEETSVGGAGTQLSTGWT